MKGVLLSGGAGTRLRPITHTGPKQLVPVANKPVLEYAVEDLRDAGIREIGVVLGNKGRREIQEFLRDGSRFGVDVTYIVQGDPEGLAHAVACAEQFVGTDDFVVYLGDNILNHGVKDMVDSYRDGDYDAGIALQEVDDPSEFGVADVRSDGSIEGLVEKPSDPPSNLALIGVYAFSPAVFDVIADLEPSWRGEYEITDAIQGMINRGYSVDSHVVEGWWKDTGRPEDVLEANVLVLDEAEAGLEGRVAETAEVTGKVDLHPDAEVQEGAVVRGPASIARGSVVGSDAYVGPYTSIGPDTVLRNAHIENSVVVGDAEITTNGRIVDSLIGRGAEIRNDDGLPEGRRLVVGENSKIKL